MPLAVADDDHGGEAEAATALDHRGAAADLDDVARSIRRELVLVSLDATMTFLGSVRGGTRVLLRCVICIRMFATRTASPPSRAAFGQGRHAAVILVRAAIEADLR